MCKCSDVLLYKTLIRQIIYINTNSEFPGRECFHLHLYHSVQDFKGDQANTVMQRKKKIKSKKSLFSEINSFE